MSKRRLVITAVLGGASQSQVARTYGVSQGWVSRLMARYREVGEAVFEPASRAPKTNPNATGPGTVEVILALRQELVAAGHDAGADTLRWHLDQRHQLTVSRATIHRILVRAGVVTASPRKRPRSSYIRFEAEQPNETWQSDFTHYRLTRPDGSPGADVEIITWLDDHSRMALHVSVHERITAQIVLTTFRSAYAEHGIPASTLTDNGMVYTVRFASQKVHGGRTAFEAELARLGVIQKNGRGGHPQTQGKVERFQQTLKKWLRNQRDQPDTLEQLQALIDTFVEQYNNDRPHRALGRRTPRAAYTSRPKTKPGDAGEPPDQTHARVRHDRVSEGKITLRHAGQLFHIGLGRHHNGLKVTALVHDLDITIIDATTGEILRELTLDPSRKYQPQQTTTPGR